MKNHTKKKKNNYVLLLVSDSPTEKIKKYKFTRARVGFIKTVITLFILALLGYVGFTSYQNTIVINRESAFTAKISELEEANAALTAEKEQLTEKVTILSKSMKRLMQRKYRKKKICQRASHFPEQRIWKKPKKQWKWMKRK